MEFRVYRVNWTQTLRKKDSDGNFKKIDTNFASIFMLLNISANMLKDEIASGIKIENRTSKLETSGVRLSNSISRLHHLQNYSP